MSSRPKRRRHVPRGKCWCEEYHGESPRSAELVCIDLEAIIGYARILQARYTHAHDYAFRASSTSLGIIGGPTGREREGGSVARVSADLKKQEQRGHLHTADQKPLDALADLRAMFSALDKVYGGRPAQVAQPIQLRKGDYFVRAKEAQQRRQDRGEE